MNLEVWKEKVLIEKLAELEHEQWVHWMKYQEKKVGYVTDMSMDEWYRRQETWKRWKKLMETPYAELTEEQKKSDREWAKKVVDVLKTYQREEVET